MDIMDIIYAKKFGGGGGAKSWNDLADRPFGEEGGIVELVPETTTLTQVNFVPIKNVPERLALGNKYIVTFDGVDYECTPVDVAKIAGIDAFMLGMGNLSDVGISNGEPFQVLEYHDESNPASDYFRIYSMDYSVAHTVSIKRDATVTTPIEGKYLPKGTPWIEEGEMVEVLPETTLDMTAEIQPYKLGLISGESYTVVYNGTEYQCVAQAVETEGTTTVCLGDIYTMSGGAFGTAATGEPFVLMEYPAEMVASMGLEGAFVFAPFEEVTEVVLSIIGKGVAIQEIDERCLPSGVPSIKKFDDIILEEVTTANVSDTFTDSVGEIVPGNIYNVIVDGVTYRCLATEGEVSDGVRLNSFLKIYYDDKGMLAATPFKITVNTPVGAQFYNYTVKINIINDEKFGVSHTFSIKGGTTRNFLSPECVPDDYPSVVYVDFVTEDGETYTTNATGDFISAMAKLGKHIVGRKMDVGGDVQFFKLESVNGGKGWKFERVFTSSKGVNIVLRYEYFVFADSSDSIDHKFGEADVVSTMILSPNGYRYLLTVSDDGTLGTEPH